MCKGRGLPKIDKTAYHAGGRGFESRPVRHYSQEGSYSGCASEKNRSRYWLIALPLASDAGLDTLSSSWRLM